MGFADATKNYFTKWRDFQSRSPRTEFWWGTLGATLISMILGAIVGLVSVMLDIDTDIAILPLQIFLLICGLALTVRRLHDINKSGWWLLIYLTVIGVLVILYWYCVKGDDGENRFGNDPLSEGDSGETTSEIS